MMIIIIYDRLLCHCNLNWQYIHNLLPITPFLSKIAKYDNMTTSPLYLNKKDKTLIARMLCQYMIFGKQSISNCPLLIKLLISVEEFYLSFWHVPYLTSKVHSKI